MTKRNATERLIRATMATFQAVNYANVDDSDASSANLILHHELHQQLSQLCSALRSSQRDKKDAEENAQRTESVLYRVQLEQQDQKQGRCKALERENDSVRAHLARMEQRCNMLQRQNQSHENIIKSLNTQLQNLQKNLSIVSFESDDLLRKARRLEVQLKGLQEEMNLKAPLTEIGTTIRLKSMVAMQRFLDPDTMVSHEIIKKARRQI